MLNRPRIRPEYLLAGGLFGFAALAILSQLLGPTRPIPDAIRGFAIGVCLGAELLGLLMVRKFGIGRRGASPR